MFLLDTNVAIVSLNGSDPQISGRLVSELGRGTPIVLSTIVTFELRFGVAKSAKRARNEAALAAFLKAPFIIAPFDEEDAAHGAEIRAVLQQAGTPIGPYDVLVAAQARRRGMVLVTANRREFARVPGLISDDWKTAA